MASPLDLSNLPSTFLLPTHLTPDQTHTITTQLRTCGCPLVSSVSTAVLFLADINTAKRSDFELRGRGLKTTPAPSNTDEAVRVVKLKWLTESLEAGEVLRMEPYTVYTGTVVSYTAPRSPRMEKAAADEKRRREILERARRDGERNSAEDEQNGDRRYGRRDGMSTPRRRKNVNELLELSKSTKVNRRQSTPEFEDGLSARSVDDMPEWVRKNVRLSCCRPTPSNSPNAVFISQLSTIRLSRTLTSESVGTTAYSTSIAALQAYPHPLRSGTEVSLLPGCGHKTSALFNEWLHSSHTPSSRTITAVHNLESSESFQILRTFHEIYGVGPHTAREWHYNKGWYSLDDVVEFGWSKLTRNIQIGVKYYNEFRQKIPRAEVTHIGEIIGRYAARLRPGMEYTLVGQYRRGGEELGDVDVVLSHRGGATRGFIGELVAALEGDGWITHTLHLGREVEDEDGDYENAGDSLEKALVVWQEVEGAVGKKNGNVHRRVDIVVVPRESVGMALLAWTGAATFERDLRLWCEKKQWRFTSEGVFEMSGGERVGSIDGEWREGEGMEDAERRVFEGLGLEWIAPEERCTY